MIALSVLCVLLPLAAALPSCDDPKVKSFEAKPELIQDPLKFFSGEKWWSLGTDKERTDLNDDSVEIVYGSASDESLNATFIHRDASGATIYTFSTEFVLEGYRWIDEGMNAAASFFQCSDNIVGGVRCQSAASPAANGTKYFMKAAWDKTDVSGEVPACAKVFTNIDPSADFLIHSHP